jgi:hypothetical protein
MHEVLVSDQGQLGEDDIHTCKENGILAETTMNEQILHEPEKMIMI